MKKTKLSTVLFLLAVTLAFTSCKKDYTCTCTTTVLGVSASTTHDLPKQTKGDATEACDRFEKDANSSGIGTTNCHL
jgi:hypothetical protein